MPIWAFTKLLVKYLKIRTRLGPCHPPEVFVGRLDISGVVHEVTFVLHCAILVVARAEGLSGIGAGVVVAVAG